MGNKVSKQQKKIHDFSFPFMDPNPKFSDDLKALEEERNKALLDKKRFAVRLSDVEELYAKKCDQNAELEIKLLDLKLEKKLLEDKLQSTKLDFKISQIERTISLLFISRMQKENNSMKHLLSKSTSFEAINTLGDTQSDDVAIQQEKKSSSHRAAKQIINKLLSDLREKDLNMSKLLQKLEVMHEEKSKTNKSRDSLPNRLATKEYGSQKIESESFSLQNSVDSFGTEKSNFPVL